MHLVEVFNSPEVQQGGNDHVIYTYMGVNDTGNLNANCNGDYGQLCSITDARGNVTLFSYGVQARLAIPRITGITDRRGTATTLTYHDTSPVYMNADTGNHRVLYYTIDAFLGRAAQVGEGDTGNNYRHITDYTWDTAAAPCTYVDGELARKQYDLEAADNNLCQLTRENATGLPTETTKFAYSPEGLILSQQQVMGGSAADLYTTSAYYTQYVRSGGQSARTATDVVTGNGDVSIGSRLAATGDGGATAGDGTVLYAVTDRISSSLPRGNASGATVANFTTGYMVADNATAEPDTNPSGASCTSRNSGSICAVSAPYQGSSKSATSYTYNDFGEKLTTAIPKAQYETPPIGQTSTLQVHVLPGLAAPILPGRCRQKAGLKRSQTQLATSWHLLTTKPETWSAVGTATPLPARQTRQLSSLPLNNRYSQTLREQSHCPAMALRAQPDRPARQHHPPPSTKRAIGFPSRHRRSNTNQPTI